MLKLFYSIYLLFATLFSGEGALILNDTTNHYHWGCTGTSTALKKEIEQLGYHVDSVSIKDLHACKEVPESIDQFSDEHLYQNFIQNNPLVFAKLKKNKVIVINGEGSIHNNRHLPRTLLYIAYISKHFLGKHVEIINHSAYPEDKLISREKTNIDLYHNVYEILDYYSVREPISKEALENIGLSPNLSFDSLPLYIKKYYKIKVERDPKLIVLSGSVAW